MKKSHYQNSSCVTDEKNGEQNVWTSRMSAIVIPSDIYLYMGSAKISLAKKKNKQNNK